MDVLSSFLQWLKYNDNVSLYSMCVYSMLCIYYILFNAYEYDLFDYINFMNINYNIILYYITYIILCSALFYTLKVVKPE